MSVLGLDRRDLEEVVFNAHRLLFQLTRDGHLDEREREQLLASITLDLAGRIAQGKSAPQLSGELGNKLLAVVADVLTTDLDELEARHARAQADGDMERAARLRARIEKRRAKEERREERPAARVERARPAAPPARPAGLSRPPSALPGPLDGGGGLLLPAAPAAPPDPSSAEPELVPLEPEPEPVPPQPKPSGRPVVYVTDPTTGQKVPKPSPFGGKAKT